LAMGAGAARQDGAGVLDLGDAAEMLGILAGERDDLVEQLGIGHDRALAAIAMPSASRVQTSQIRISSVGLPTPGRRSHHSLLPSSISPAATSTARWRSYSPQLSNSSGRPVRGSSANTAMR